MAARGLGDDRRAAPRHHHESRANVSPPVCSPLGISTSDRDPIANRCFARANRPPYGVQVRADLRGDREEYAADRHVEDAHPRGLSRFPQQRGVPAGQVPALRRSLHESAESNLGSHSVAVREVTRSLTAPWSHPLASETPRVLPVSTVAASTRVVLAG